MSLGRPFPRSAVAYSWHNKRYLRKIVGDFFHFGKCPIIALEYRQVLHIDRGVDPKVVVTPSEARFHSSRHLRFFQLPTVFGCIGASRVVPAIGFVH